MELVVDLSTGDVVLRQLRTCSGSRCRPCWSDPERRSRPWGPRRPGGGAAGQRAGTVGPDGDVLVPPAAVRRLAVDAAKEDGSSLDPDWEAGFAGMVAVRRHRGLDRRRRRHPGPRRVEG